MVSPALQIQRSVLIACRIQPEVLDTLRRNQPDLLALFRAVLQIRRSSHDEALPRLQRQQILYQVAGGFIPIERSGEVLLAWRSDDHMGFPNICDIFVYYRSAGTGSCHLDVSATFEHSERYQQTSLRICRMFQSI